MTAWQAGSLALPGLRRGAGLLAVAALVLCGNGATVASPAPADARAVTLAGKTTITWSGTRGIRLVVPRETELPPEGGTRIFVKGGTYAFVRYIRFAECHPPYAFCSVQGLSYVREFGDAFGQKFKPGIDHERDLDTPPVLMKDTYDLYLFTDGEATLELYPRGLSGRVARRAAGRVSGTAALVLDHSCPTAGCSARGGYAGRLRFGGVARDVGAFGYAEMRTYNFDTVSYPVSGVGIPYAQPHPGRACIYPSLFHKGSPSPADHPFGCDVVSSTSEPDDNVENLGRLYMFAGFGVSGYGGTIMQDSNPEARGRVYLGFQAANAYDLSKPRVLPYAISFRYGIS